MTPQVMTGLSIQRPPTATGYRDGSRQYVPSIIPSTTQGTDSPDSAQTPSYVQSKFKAPDTPLLARAINNYYTSASQGPFRTETPVQQPAPSPAEHASFPPRVTASDSHIRATEQNIQERVGVTITRPPTSVGFRTDNGKTFQHPGPIVTTLSVNPEVIQIHASMQPKETPIASNFNHLHSSSGHTVPRIENSASQSAFHQIWKPHRVTHPESQSRSTESNDRIVASVGGPSTIANQREDDDKVPTPHTCPEISQERVDSQPTTSSSINVQTPSSDQAQTRMENSNSVRYPYPSLSVRPVVSSGQTRVPEIGDRPAVEVHTALPPIGASSGDDSGKSARPPYSLATSQVSQGPRSVQIISNAPPARVNPGQDSSPGDIPRQHLGGAYQNSTVTKEEIQRTRFENLSQGHSTHFPIQTTPSNREGETGGNNSLQHYGTTTASSALPREESHGIRAGNFSLGPLSTPAQLSISGPSIRANAKEDDSPRSRPRHHPGVTFQNTVTIRDEGYNTRIGNAPEVPSGAQPLNSGLSNRPILREDDTAGGKTRQNLSIVPQNVIPLREETHSSRIGGAPQASSHFKPSSYGLSSRTIQKEDDSPTSKPGQPMGVTVQNSTATFKDGLTARVYTNLQRPSTPARPTGYIHPNSSSDSANVQPTYPAIPSSTVEAAPAPNIKQESSNARHRLTNIPSTPKVELSSMQMPALSLVKQESPRMQSTLTAQTIVHPLLPTVNLENVPSARQRRDSKQDSPRTRTENRPSGSSTKPTVVLIPQETSLPLISNPSNKVENSSARTENLDNVNSQGPVATSSRDHVPEIPESAVTGSGSIPQPKTPIPLASNAHKVDTGLYAVRSTPQVTSLNLSIDPGPPYALAKINTFAMHAESMFMSQFILCCETHDSRYKVADSSPGRLSTSCRSETYIGLTFPGEREFDSAGGPTQLVKHCDAYPIPFRLQARSCRWPY